MLLTHIKFWLIFTSFLLNFTSVACLAQDSTQTAQVKNPDKKKKKAEDKTFVVLPIITGSPETSLRLGVIGIFFFRFKEAPEGTRPSIIRFPISYTIRNQAKIRASYEIAFSTPKTINKHIIQGQTFWIRFPLFFYGIGKDTPESAEEVFTSQTAFFELNYFANVAKDIFLGARVDFSDGRIVETEEGGLLESDNSIAGRTGGRKSGVGITARWDKRINIINPSVGPFFEGRLTTYQSWLGSEFEYTQLRLDLRHYKTLFDKRFVLGLHTVTEINWGTPQFEYTALLGGDHIMRGHLEGRFRDNMMWATQAELRIPINRKTWINDGEVPFKKRWGLVAFGGVGNVAPSLSDATIDHIKTSYGLGIRYLISREESVNIRIDFAFGTQTPGFYLNIREAF